MIPTATCNPVSIVTRARHSFQGIGSEHPARQSYSILPFSSTSRAWEPITQDPFSVMTLPVTNERWSPDWAELWRYGACWAGRPIGGLLLPGHVRSVIMSQVMEDLMKCYDQLPGELQCRAFIQSSAVSSALETTRRQRLATGVADLWHDSAHRPTTPVIDLSNLQSAAPDGSLNGARWSDLHKELRPRALGYLRGEGVSDADADDLFAEALTGLIHVRKNGSAVIQDILVYEQLPMLFMTIIRRKLANFLRHRHAARRAVNVTESLDSEEDMLVSSADQKSFSTWASDAADPFNGLTFARLAEECARGLSALQQKIFCVLYVEESATYMEVACSNWFAKAADLKPTASDATRRRALDKEHDEALEILAESLGLPRTPGLG